MLTDTITSGDTLPNGATVVAINRVSRVVLAKFRNEYVSWRIGDNADTYWGRYYSEDYDESWERYMQRCQGC